MSILISLVIVVLCSWFLREAIRKYPAIFYVVALLISAVGIYFTWHPVANEAVRAIAFAIQKGHLGFSMFAVVMFIGVFNKQSQVYKNLSPIRAKLSIVGSFLIVGHFMPYLKGYLEMLGNLFSFRPSIIVSFIIAVLLLILLILLATTSFEAIKRRMNAKAWKAIQKLSYVFFVLIFVHLAGFLIAAFMKNQGDMLVNGIIYAVIIVAYLILRIVRGILDRRKSERPAR